MGAEKAPSPPPPARIVEISFRGGRRVDPENREIPADMDSRYKLKWGIRHIGKFSVVGDFRINLKRRTREVGACGNLAVYIHTR